MKKLVNLLLLIALLVFFAPPAFASSPPSPQIEQAMDKAKSYLYDLEKDRGALSPWSYVALAGSGDTLDGSAVRHTAELLWNDESLQSGDMSSYCRLVFTLLSAGEDPCSYHGQNLIRVIQHAQLPGGKFPDNIQSGGEELVNAHIWAILALTAAGAPVPDREKAIQWLVDRQHADGSFYWYAPDQKTPDVDSTGMALMALGALGVKKDSPAVQKAVAYLQKVQKPNGGLESWGAENPECCSMVIQGLTAVGIDPTGPEFTKPGGNPVTAMLGFQLPDGSFEHVKGSGPNEMATQQAIMGLADVVYGNTLFERLRAKVKAGLEGNSAKTQQYLARFQVGEKSYTLCVSGRQEAREIDVSPFIANGRTYVPVRYLAYAMGVPDQGVSWDGESRTVTLTLGSTTVKLVMGEKALRLNGAVRPMDVAPVIVNGRVFLPARFVAEAFSYKVNWIEATREVLITR